MMKRLLVFLGLFLIFCYPCYALNVNGVPAVSSTSVAGTPVSSLGDGLHLLDNVQPSGCRDVLQGQWLGCTGSSVYKKYYLSLDAVYAVPIGGNGFFAPGARVYIGQLLMDQVPSIQRIAVNNVVLTSALNYLSAGGFYTRDLNQGIDHAGYYMGFLVKFS